MVQRPKKHLPEKVLGALPSRKLTYPTWGSSENNLQNGIFRGYVSSQEGIFYGLVF